LKIKTFALLAFASIACVIAAEAAEVRSRSTVETSQTPTRPMFGSWGVDLSGIDKNKKPGDEFFGYANGNWYDRAVVPSDRTSTGSFVDLGIQSEDRVRAIVRGLESQTGALTPDEQRVRDLYHSYVDTPRLERLGLAPAKPVLDGIDEIRTSEDVAQVMGSVTMGTKALFRSSVGVDDKNPNSYAVFLGQAGLGLPDRDYYLLNDKAITAARDGYRAYIAKTFDLAQIPGGAEKAAGIFNLETEIAKLHWARVERRNADKVYNPMTVAELEHFAPGFPWRVFLAGHGIPGAADGTRRVIVEENTAFPALAALFANTPVETWRDYLSFHYLSDHASYLPKRFDEARFELFGKTMGGQKEQLAREKRGVGFIDGVIGQGVGKLFVARYFPPEAKVKAQVLVSNLLAIYRQRLQAADWMSPATRQQALEKLAKLNVKIGYPDQWRDYSKFRVDPNDLLGNGERAGEFEWNRRLARLDQPVDRSEWGMSPQTVNAYYSSSLNEIVFPAAILQPPFFDPAADDAVNYGGIGAVIGHEISHAFDDQGSKYDASGELKNWWTAEDRKNFDARTGALAKQFSSYAPLPGLYVNGQLTLGENIADLAGVTVAQAAYHLSLNGKAAPVLDGYTGDQRFFLGFAQVWRYKSHDETARQRLLSDPHSPPQFRVDGTVRNTDAWYSAFNVNPSDTLYLAPEMRVHLW
jgi:putative endopeptidase